MYFYAYDSYDLTGLLGPDGKRALDIDSGSPGYQLSYSVDWTGANLDNTDPRTDASNQMQYSQAPFDKTMLTACTYHAVVAHTEKCPMILLSGTVKPVDVKKFYTFGWDTANHF